ncbi:LCP family protein [Natranaerobius trueperi]|uniref:LytR/CpsA/Psr regulator C-terminal domain-containing protein n=1 Tax=Natranaerobius trueperi TaxID=759412 RepID=A0A226BYC4_9FIRM|nr:LytR C-terminal domain-containing protein [Natranaerobius trueperi]OWZ83935.1 hypothetical protein CDO51_05990 [Natranaerobius trueperi]
MSYTKRYRKDKRTRKKAKLKKERIFALIILIITFFVLGAAVRYIISGRNLETEADWVTNLSQDVNDQYTNTLVAVVDDSHNILKYITILNQKEDSEELNTIFIPGETYLDTPGNDFEILMESYSKGHIDLLIDTVKDYLGVSIHNFIKIESGVYSGIKNELNFISDVNHDKFKTQVLEKDLKEGDIQKIFTDHLTSIENFYNNTNERKGFFNTPRVRKYIEKQIETNFTWDQMIEWIDTTVVNANENLVAFKLPGEQEVVNDQKHFLPDFDELEIIVEQYFSKKATKEVSKDNITIEVLNGSGVSGVAEDASDMLEEVGFDVVSIGNADNFDYQSSKVIARKEPRKAAKEVALEINQADLLVELKDDFEAMVTVIIGENFEDN